MQSLGEPHPSPFSLVSILFYLVLTVVSLSLRIPHFSPLAVIGPDGSEYVYCVEKHQLPHSPYLLYMWMGFLLRRFIRLDWGYAGLSMVCSLVTTVLFGRVAEHLYRNRFAGWVAATVFALLPVSIRYSGLQEVYTVQIFWLVLAWWALVACSSPLGCGLAAGAAVTTHNGTVFALPALLLLFHQCSSPPAQASSFSLFPRKLESMVAFLSQQVEKTIHVLKKELLAVRHSSPAWWKTKALAWEAHAATWVQEEETPFRNLARASARWPFSHAKAFYAWKPQWAKLLAGFLIPQVIVMTWLLIIWIQGHGLRGLPLLRHFLRGVAPDPGTRESLGTSWWDCLWRQSARTWNELANPDVLGFVPLLMGLVLLLLCPLRKTLVWWLLAIPYLLYEMTLGMSLDWGIYLVFVVPAVAAGLALGTACWSWSSNRPLNLLRILVCATGLAGLFFQIPAFQVEAEVRRLLPWYREGGAIKALSDWVRMNSPKDSLVIQPMDWHFAGLASTLYTDRIPLFRESGGILLPGRWRPLFNNDKFGHVRTVTTQDFEQWLDTERPILSFDADPFHTWSAYWPKVDIERYETRPILWLDHNQSGTSDLWRNIRILAIVDIGDPTAEAPYHVQYSENRIWADLEIAPFRPTLYRIARKTDPPGSPQWVKDLQALVPEKQRTPPSPVRDEGFSIKAGEGPISLRLPSLPGRDHVLRLTLQSVGWDYVVECQVRTGARWVYTDRDMEKITGDPGYYFTDLYLRVPARYVHDSNLDVRLLPALGTPTLNAFQIEWGVDNG